MKICEGLELDPKTFGEQVRGMRHVKPLAEAAGRLNPKLKRAINKDLESAGFGGKKKFRKIGDAVAKALEVLNKHGLEQDEVLSTDKFRSHNKDGVMGGRTLINVAASDPKNAFAPAPISGTGLSMSWTEMGKNVEVIAYMS
jgi:hypothetical protein